MNAKALKLKLDLEQAIKDITLNEPEGVKRMRTGTMTPPAGAYKQFFTTLFFADAEVRGITQPSLITIDHCLRDDLFTVEHVRVLAGYMLPFSGEFLDYAGLREIWGFLKRFLDVLAEVDSKSDMAAVCRALLVYTYYYHAWTHLAAPWGSGGAEFTFKSKEDQADVEKFRLSNAAMEKMFPLGWN